MRKHFSTAFLLRFSALIASIACVVFLSGPSLAADYGGTFIGAYKDEPATLNPILEVSTVSSIISQILFDGLVTLTPSGKVSPRLAAKWSVSADGLSWTFFLRKNVRFHDGALLTSKDVKFTYDAFQKSPGSAQWKQVFENVREIRALDRFTVEFVLRKPSSNFLAILYLVGVLPEHILARDPFGNAAFNRKPMGTGPFRLASWKPGKEILLESNKEYFGGRPYLDRIRVVHIPDVFTMWKMLQLGRIDGVYNEIMPIDFDFLKGNAGLRTFRLPDYMNYVVVFNFKKRVFQDRRMRIALNTAVDRKEIIRTALLGNGVECNGAFRPGSAGIPNDNDYNPETSVRLLAEMGYADRDNDGILDKNGKKLSFRVLIDSKNLLKRRVMLDIQKQLMDVGIEVIGEDTSVPEIIAKGMTGDYDMIFLNYATFLDMAVLFWHTKSIRNGCNLSHYSNDKVDTLFDVLTSRRGNAERDRIMKNIFNIMKDDAAGMFLFSKFNLVAVNGRIHGYVTGKDKFFWEYVNDIFIPKALQ